METGAARTEGVGAWVRRALEYVNLRAGVSLDRVVILATVLTPFAVVLDSRLHGLPWQERVTTALFLEDAGRPVSFWETPGSAFVWVLLGALILVLPRTRRGLFTAPTIVMLTYAVSILVASAVDGTFDRLTIEVFLAAGLPIVAMLGLSVHRETTFEGLRVAITALCSITAVLVAGTILKRTISGQLGERLDLATTGAATDTGAYLAALTVLAALLPIPTRLKAPLVMVLAAGLVLTQTRGAELALGAALLCAAALSSRVRWWAVGLAAVVVAGLVAGPRTLSLFGASNAFRRASIEHHFLLMLERPSLGYGVSRSTLSEVAGAQDSLLGIANGAGVYAALLFLGAWLVPLCRRGLRHVSVTGACVFTVYVVSWITTGNELQLQVPATNLLPLALAIGYAAHEMLSIPAGSVPVTSSTRRTAAAVL
jgi:hypothetical protein